jgi:hypothetical protein
MMHKLMAVYREEGRFVVRIDLSADFDENYEGDNDGYVWLDHWRAQVSPRIVRAVFDALRAEPGFEALPAPRGKSPEEELEIAVRFKAADGKPKKP